jgi:TRAP-type C4-dicarboxylate transport system permease large subunit
LAIILGGILGGVFTAIEAGAVACIWAFFVRCSSIATTAGAICRN